ncbi:protein-export chaperone SecB [Sphingomicrobium nitratireducens]|uniref:protein-export chaperone SecB n=1 Tax=Sphingomicrobium nitratireducens TaxID=2964666 RepID=UPI0022409C02|nr:protein-export chaperone SecB [Sphingomicrobium nitratireducens]
MADETPQQPIQPQQNGTTESSGPQVATLAQYVKDLSVENPNAPQVYQYRTQGKIDLDFKIDVNKVSDDVHEVVLKIEARGASEEGVHFVVDLSYAGLFGIRNFPEEQLHPYLMVEAPRMLFPFARQILATATQEAGFPPLMLDPVDFGAAYMAQANANAQAMAAAGEEPAGNA